jgi:hypothetical protein
MADVFPTTRADFFGKDGMTFFMGQVEDVKDPKLSGRVKVRCVGWHPKEKTGEDSLNTEDLPWAHVAMPTTHPQGGRVGGKHGLLPGCWVIGFFFDGQEAQQPIVLNTFNFTANASKENNRSKPTGTDGTLDVTDAAFGKHMLAADLFPTAGRTTQSDKDPAMDVPLTDAKDSPCGDLMSDASVQRMEQPQDSTNPTSQIYDVIMGDGLCGAIAHAKDDIQRKLAEKLPPGAARYVFNDVVWSAMNGNRIDLNGIISILAQEISNLLMQPLQATKAEVEDKVNRSLKTAALAVPDRDGFLTIIADEATTLASDMFHGIFATGHIDILSQLIMSILQSMNSGGGQGSGDNYTGNVGASPNTDIQDWGSPCITDSILDTVNVLTDIALTNSRENSSSSSSVPGALGGILSSLVGAMIFPLTQKYSIYTDIFNHAGEMSQDIITKNIGCLFNRTFNTGFGYGSGINDVAEYRYIGFGGRVGEPDTSGVPTVCEDALSPPTWQGTGDSGTGGDTGESTGNGSNADATSESLPSANKSCGLNYINGIPNAVVISNHGKNYFYDNTKITSKITKEIQVPDRVFPKINIPGYKGTPIPVVDSKTGELVAVIVNCELFSPNQRNRNVGIIPPIRVPPYSRVDGITTDDPNYSIELGGVFVQNMGFGYCDPKITVYDRDLNAPNGEVGVTVRDGHIVDVEVINSGRGFLRIPELRIKDKCDGYGAKLYPIMNVIPNTPSNTATSDRLNLPPVEVIYCPGKNQTNNVRA